MNTKDFWQQEQAILAFLILFGYTKKKLYLELAREAMAFWNVFFLDLDNGGVYFRTTGEGIPVVKGGYATKGGVNISGLGNSKTYGNNQIVLPETDKDVEVIVHFHPIGEPYHPIEEYAPPIKGKIGILVESHFDEKEVGVFEKYLPANGYQIEYMSNLWDLPYIEFTGNDYGSPLRVYVDIDRVDIDSYAGFILVGGYAMDRLRYETNPIKGQPNQSKAAIFIRKVMTKNKLVGVICHSAWLLASAGLLKGRKLTCANNILYDVQDAGGDVQFCDVFVDGKLISGKHPDVSEPFIIEFINQLVTEYQTPRNSLSGLIIDYKAKL